jgi:hypothetical protein
VPKDDSYVEFATPMARDLGEVKALANSVNLILGRADVIREISNLHVLGASSHSIQNAIISEVEKLGFVSEKKGLFDSYKVPGIRPDYYKPLPSGGILFEVERGKTLANNMDLLDVWKTHICREANHLFLLVPKVRVTHKGSNQKIFQAVVNRVGTFWSEQLTPIDVDSVHIFGY